MNQPDRSIILIGFMGSGKSSIGKLLAEKLGWPHWDTDEILAARAGKTVAEIFRQRGEAAFREMEDQLLQELSADDRRVLTTGGGIVLCPENRRRLRSLGKVVWLRVDREVLVQRLLGDSTRPLLRTEGPAATIAQLLQAREAFYEEAAHFVLETSGLTPDAAAVEILKLLNRS